MGAWKNLIEMEDHLTLDELYLLRNALFESEHRRDRMVGAAAGVDIDEDTESTTAFEEIERKAREELGLAGKSKDGLTFDEMGIVFEDDDD